MSRADTPQAVAAAPAREPSERTAGPRTAAVVVTWNAATCIAECLRSLAASATCGDAEVVVVDNASTDGTAEVAARVAPWCRVIRNRENRGLAAANNQGIRATTAPHVLISNPDVVLEPGAIDALAACLAEHPRAAFAFPQLRHPDGTLQTTAGDLPGLAEALLGRQWARWRAARVRGERADDRPGRGMWWDGWAHDEERRVGHGLEACFLVRRDALGDIGLQDERYWLDWEGIDWCARAEAAGWESWFTPAARAVHAGGVSVRQAPRRWIVATHRSMYTYFADRTPRPARPLLAAAFAARATAKLAAARLGSADYDRSHPGSGAGAAAR